MINFTRIIAGPSSIHKAACPALNCHHYPTTHRIQHYPSPYSNLPNTQIRRSPQNRTMVTGPLVEMLARNSKFAQTYQAPPPLMQMATGMRASGAGVVVISCSDPRLNPYQILGIDATLKATMVRNAGGRTLDAIRTLAVLQTIGAPGTIVVMHHTDCGMIHFHDADIKKALLEIAPNHKELIDSSKFGEITKPIEETIKEDIAILRASPLIKKTTQIVGLAYDIHTGVLSEVKQNKSEL